MIYLACGNTLNIFIQMCEVGYYQLIYEVIIVKLQASRNHVMVVLIKFKAVWYLVAKCHRPLWIISCNIREPPSGPGKRVQQLKPSKAYVHRYTSCDNSLSPDRCHATVRTIAGIFVSGPVEIKHCRMRMNILFNTRACVWKCSGQNCGYFVSVTIF